MCLFLCWLWVFYMNLDILVPQAVEPSLFHICPFFFIFRWETTHYFHYLSRGKGVEVLLYRISPRDLTLPFFDCIQLSWGGFEFHSSARFLFMFCHDLLFWTSDTWSLGKGSNKEICSFLPLGFLSLLKVFLYKSIEKPHLNLNLHKHLILFLFLFVFFSLSDLPTLCYISWSPRFSVGFLSG